MQNVKSIIELNLELVQDRIADACHRAKRRPEAVTLVAVTKSVGVHEARLLAELGVKNVGENRVQDAVDKMGMLANDFPDLRWHLIGNLQTNKIKYCVDKCYLLHAVDSLHLAEAVNREAEKKGTHVNALIEVNIAGEVTKHGLQPEELPAFLEQALEFPEIEWRGLMTMAPFYQNPEETRPVFAELRRLLEENGQRFGITGMFRELSMGMTNDFEIAVEEGATLVRVGTALFGGLAL